MAARWDEVRQLWDDAVKAGSEPSWQGSAVKTRRLLLFRGSTPIAITGLGGTGKTVLFDALMNRISSDYRPKGKSLDWERHRVLIKGKRRTRANLLIVPGQKSLERNKSLERAFGASNSPMGVIHVVSWGFNEPWERLDARTHRDDRAEAATRRAAQLKAEYADFRDLCNNLRAPQVVSRLKWLVVAVAKADLYWSEINRARDHYVPSGATVGDDESEFCRELRDLTNNPVGYPAKVAILPFSAYLARHSFGDRLPERGFQLEAPQVRALRNNFCDALGRLL